MKLSSRSTSSIPLEGLSERDTARLEQFLAWNGAHPAGVVLRVRDPEPEPAPEPKKRGRRA